MRRDEDATIWSAYAQVQTYKAEIPSLLHYNAVLVVSDGLQARIGSLTANQEWFKVWRTIDGRERCADRQRWSWRRWSAASSSGSGSSICSSISSSSRKTRTRARCTRSSRATISSTR